MVENVELVREVAYQAVRVRSWRFILQSCICPANLHLIRADAPRKYRLSSNGTLYALRRMIAGGLIEKIPGPRNRFVTTQRGKAVLKRYPPGPQAVQFVVGVETE